jgi:ribosomal protein S18 acetylase RimI-like enzyme
LVSEFSVREGTLSDLGAVVDIKVRSWAETYASLLEPAVLGPFLNRNAQLAELRRDMALPTTHLLVAQDRSGVVVGFAMTYLDRAPNPWLESLHVVDRVRGRGAGTLLMRSLATQLRERGFNSLGLGVIAGNQGAARFYERLGATLVGVEPVSWAKGVRHQVYRWADLDQLTS